MRKNCFHAAQINPFGSLLNYTIILFSFDSYYSIILFSFRDIKLDTFICETGKCQFPDLNLVVIRFVNNNCIIIG